MLQRQTLAVFLVAIMIGASVVPMGVAGATSSASDSTPTHESFQETHTEAAAEQISATATSAASEITLITGQTVTVRQTSNGTQYTVDANVSMQQISTANSTYIFPATVDFDKFHPSLFNIDLLKQQNLTDGEASSIPIIIRSQAADSGQFHAATEQMASASGYTADRQLASINGQAGDIDKQSAATLSEQIKQSDTITDVYLDQKVQVSLDRATEMVNAPSARQQYNVSGENVTVAVLDTGVDETHPDLDEGTEVLEQDFTTDNTTRDVNGHGTHVAGIITGDGEASNGTYVGVAPNASIMDLRVLNSDGYGQTSWIIDAIEFASDHDADVISLSLGGQAHYPRGESPFTPAINAAVEQGSVVSIAAGNSGPAYRTVGSPGIVKQAITVGATGFDGTSVASFSSRGPTPVGTYVKPDLLAPGTDIMSTASSAAGYSEPYVSYSGTSMATPMVSGAAALVLDAQPSLSPQEVKSALSTTSNPVSQADVYTQGAGQIDIPNAIQSDLLINSSTVDFGTLTTSQTVTRTFTIENTGETTRSLTLDASLENIMDANGATATVNETSLSVAPGETQTVALSVDSPDSVGIYSGRVQIQSESRETPHTVIFGFGRAHNITVEKTPVTSAQSVANDWAFLQPHASGSLGQPKLKQLSAGQTSFATYSDDVSVYSVGRNEVTNSSIITAETLSTTEDTTVTLDESATVKHEIAVSGLEQDVGTLSNYLIDHTVQQQVPTPEGDRPVEISFLSPAPEEPSVRTTPMESLNLSLKGTFTEEADLETADAVLDVPDVYLLHYGTIGTQSGQTFTVQPDRLATVNTTYRRTDPSQTYQAILTARTISWGPQQNPMAVPFPIGDRQTQEIHLTPSTAVYSIGAQNSSNAAQPWALRPLGEHKPEVGAEYNRSVNQHPFTGSLLNWHLVDSEWMFVTTFQSSPGMAALESAPANRLRIELGDEVLVDDQFNNPIIGTSSPIPVSPGTTITLQQTGVNDALPLSTESTTTYQVTYEPGVDPNPPELRGPYVPGLDMTNTVSAETVRLYAPIDGTGSNISSVTAYVGDHANGTPFNSSSGSGWQEVNATEVAPNVYEVSFNASQISGKVDIAIRAVDEANNTAEYTVHDGIRVDGPGPDIQPVVGDNAPTDPDGDGVYEDVNGDGTANVVDVQALFANYQDDVIQNNLEAFDFNNDGAVNVVDVQKLFKEL